MPIGHNLTKCRTCFKEYICGDCIETECRECQCKRLGHLAVQGINICGRCGARDIGHKWVGKRSPDTPKGLGEYVVECSECGQEKPPSWLDIEIPPCEKQP